MSPSRKKLSEKYEPEIGRGSVVEEIGKSVRLFLMAGALVWIAYIAGDAIKSLAGKDTQANILVSLLGSIEVSMALSWMAGGAGVVYGYKQARLRKTTIERLQGRIKELEKLIDKRRSSSKLTPRGETNPGDL